MNDTDSISGSNCIAGNGYESGGGGRPKFGLLLTVYND